MNHLISSEKIGEKVSHLKNESQFNNSVFRMKSLIKVLVIFWVSQSVFCNIITAADNLELFTSTIAPLTNLIKSSSLEDDDNELVNAFNKSLKTVMWQM